MAASSSTQPTVNPVTCVNKVLAAGKIDENLETRNKRILNDFLGKLLPAMKANNRDFARIYQKLYYTGSYYENLRIKDPNEFDINLILKLPFRSEHRDFEYMASVKSFIKYKLRTNGANSSVLHENTDLLRTLFEGEYLSPERVRRWIQGVVDSAIPSVPLPAGVARIIPSASGPAKTMLLITTYGYEIDVDLVPVIQFSFPEWPKGARKDMLNIFQVKNEDRFWFMVPKEFPSGDTSVNPIDARRLWRIHFPEIEKKIIHNRGQVKPLIKLLKALRNNEKWDILASYYLKTIVLWMVEKHPSPDYWKDTNIFLRLTEALESLRENVKRKFIKYYFYPEFNLIQKIGQSQADIICNRLDRILRSINANPETLEDYFKI